MPAVEVTLEVLARQAPARPCTDGSVCGEKNESGWTKGRPTRVGADNYSRGPAAWREPVEDTVLIDDDSEFDAVEAVRQAAEVDRSTIGYAAAQLSCVIEANFPGLGSDRIENLAIGFA